MAGRQSEVRSALRRLAKQPGFTRRPGQEQAALLISDCIECDETAMIEAPTGSGKSLAALIPALVHARRGGRVIIATYTNVLAEQYWRKDLPAAIGLFKWTDKTPRIAYLVGRSRYACRLQLEERQEVPVVQRFLEEARLGLDSEFFACTRTQQGRKIWRDVSVPAACQGRECRFYQECFFYKARSEAREANIVITNHSVFVRDLLIRDAAIKKLGGEEVPPHRLSNCLLGNYDFVILDEAHDLPSAVASTMGFELNQQVVGLVVSTVERALQDPLLNTEERRARTARVRRTLDKAGKAVSEALSRFEMVAHEGILKIAPESLLADFKVGQHSVGELTPLLDEVVREIEQRFGSVCEALLRETISEEIPEQDVDLKHYKTLGVLPNAELEEIQRAYRRLALRLHPEDANARMAEVNEAYEALRNLDRRATHDAPRKVSRVSAEGEDEIISNLVGFIFDFIQNCRLLADPDEVSLTAVSFEREGGRMSLNRRVVNVGERLGKWMVNGPPCVMMSATMTVDGSFEFLSSETGLQPKHKEVLPQAFDTCNASALYVPPPEIVPDPAVTRFADGASAYYATVAQVVKEILEAVAGRSLVLFHSRREMEEVYRRVAGSSDLRILMQPSSGARGVGERFREDVAASLFAVRSFWTGFDAPGETLSCVIMVRIPFEVPVEPEQLVRQAWYRSRNLSPFREYTLPMAKMMVRQGAGRLLRSPADRGVICLLDSRIHTRTYGAEVLANLPRTHCFSSIREALAHVGLSPTS